MCSSIQLTHNGVGDNVLGDKIVQVERGDVFKQLNDSWFNDQVSVNIRNLGVRYTPLLNVSLELSKGFEAISRSQLFQQECTEQIEKFRSIFDLCLRRLQGKSSIEHLTIAKGYALELEKCFQVLQQPGVEPFQTSQAKKVLNKLKELCGALTKRDDLVDEDFSRVIHRMLDALRSVDRFVDSKKVALATTPQLVITGEGGTGKSHLLADALSIRIQRNKKSLFILGQHLLSDQPPLIQILEQLSLPVHSDEFFEFLNEVALSEKERLLIVIDAVNEGNGKKIWPNHLLGMMEQIKRYPWLALIVSVRSSYCKLFRINELKRSGIVCIEHVGFMGRQEAAVKKFFSYYNINSPRVPLLMQEFSNPLYLKLFCESLYRNGVTNVPDGFRGISSVAEFFLKSVNEKAAEERYFDYPESKKLVQKAVTAFVNRMIDDGARELEYDLAYDLVEEAVRRYSSKRHFIEFLIEEGVLTKGIRQNEEIVYVAYERLADHWEADCLVSPEHDGIDKKRLEAMFAKRQTDQQGVLEAIAVLLPEKVGEELFEVVTEEYRLNNSVVRAVLQSLVWRKYNTVSLKVESYIFEELLHAGRYKEVFGTLYYLVAEYNHPLCFDKVHSYLKKNKLPERDAFWIPFIDAQSYEGTAIARLFDWKDVFLAGIDIDPRGRYSLALGVSWILASTNIVLRESATLALSALFENQLELAERICREFITIDDPYVFERVLAACFGATLRSRDKKGLDHLAAWLTDEVFLQDTVYPNVLVRDYARSIVEYAYLKEYFVIDDIDVIRPPYKSNFPEKLPSNEDVDSYKGIGRGLDDILSSMVTEYGRGTCCYGDFGRYTFESALGLWKIDANPLSNYACTLIIDKFGYSDELHGRFDQTIRSVDRFTNDRERIGKKYQWLALYEVVARVADNYKIEESSWEGDVTHSWYQGPWQNYLRNFDPTLLAITSNVEGKILFPNWKDVYQNWDVDVEAWGRLTSDLPDFKQLIDTGDVFSLENYITWKEPKLFEEENYSASQKQLWVQIRSYFVLEEEFDYIFEKLKERKLYGRWMPEGIHLTKIFAHELYWGASYQEICESEDWSTGWREVSLTPPASRRPLTIDEHVELLLSANDVSFEEDVTEVLPSVNEYSWEGREDSEQPKFFHIPTEELFDGCKLESSHNYGCWVDTSDKIVCYDFSAVSDEYRGLGIKKEILEKFLAKKGYRIIWTCLGEKQVMRDHYVHDKGELPILFSGWYTLEKGKVVGSINCYEDRS